ncbi:MAG: hypothetical protein C5B51_07995 [Terriglobia bacterium]|nr:MAG: hypothetical protein C5B51_07995 [Terriglobia bacterium]
MNPEDTRKDSALDRVISEIRDEIVPPEVIEAAAGRVWTRLSEPAEHIRTCDDFQALFAEYRAGRLSGPRALLVQDHLSECVACRRVFQGKVQAAAAVPIAAPRKSPAVRWAVAAGLAGGIGLAAWFSIAQFGGGSGPTLVQSVAGTLYEVNAGGLHSVAAGTAVPAGMELRTARDSGAMLLLRDGSTVEMGERADFLFTETGGETTVHLGGGRIIVRAAKRRSGHLYVATADCRVSVTGTLFGVSTGVKGSRVSVLEGEVRVTHHNQEKVLHPGDQETTGESLDPAAQNEDFAWSRDARLKGELAALRQELHGLRFPQARYSSRLLGLLPASTVFFAGIPNLAEYLGEAQKVFRRKASESPELDAWLAGPGASIEPVLEKLRAASEYLGDEIVVFGTEASAGPVFLAEVKRPGFPEFLKQTGLPLAVEVRSGVVLFGSPKQGLAPLLDSGFRGTPFYARIADVYRQGAGLLLCGDLTRMGASRHGLPEARYLIAEQKQAGQRLETHITLGFDGPRTGIAAWLAAPSSLGALDYVTPQAALVMGFAVANPAAAFNQMSVKLPQPEAGELERDLAASLGGEIALAMDGPVFPVPSWKLVAEVYDPARFQSAIQRLLRVANREGKPLRTSQETSDGRTDYLIAGGDPNPLTQAWYTFSRGYLIAAPTRALLTTALQTRSNGAGIARSANFTALLPRDHYTDFSAVLYRNLGPTIAPLAGLFDPKGAGKGVPLEPLLIAAYGEPDRIAVASSGDFLGMNLNDFLSGSVLRMANSTLPWSQVLGTIGGRSSSR